MLPFVMLALTAMAQAAAISKSFLQPRSSEPLIERMSFVHNYAIVCMYDRDVTNFCQKYYGYGCDSQGKLRTALFEENCDVLCSCIDLSPKPACMVGLTGQSWCLRDPNQDSDVQDRNQEISVMGNASPMSPSATTTDLAFPGPPPDSDPASSSLTTSDTLSRIVQILDSELHTVAPNKLAPDDVSFHTSHKWAMLCTGNESITTDCSRAGYNCDMTGSVRAFRPSDQYCIDMCVCIDRLSKTSCSVDENGMIKCNEGGIREETVVRHIIEVLPSNHSLASRNDGVAEIPHNYAMVCASDKEETIFCQKDGYYCNYNGKIVIPAIPNKYCTDYCVCIDVGTKMYCMMANSGAMYCLRSEMSSEFHLFDHTQDTSFDTASSGSAGKVTKRSEHYESTDHANLKQTDLNAPLHNDNADWGSHNMAMVCMQDRFFTNFCQDFGYFCSSSGSLFQKNDGVENLSCEALCQCIDLYPKPNCIMNVLGGVQCARDLGDQENELNDAEVLDLQAPLHNENTDLGSHNMAMVCLNDKSWTNFCQENGYYCTSSGNLVQKPGLWGNVGCQTNCQCIDLLPKPNCIMNLIGPAVCARDMEEAEHDKQEVTNKAEQKAESTHTRDEEDIHSPEIGTSDGFMATISSKSTLTTSVRTVSLQARSS